MYEGWRVLTDNSKNVMSYFISWSLSVFTYSITDQEFFEENIEIEKIFEGQWSIIHVKSHSKESIPKYIHMHIYNFSYLSFSLGS